MRSLDHASKRSMHCQIAEGIGEVRFIYTLFVLQKRILAAIEIRKQRQISISRLTVSNRPAAVHHLITILAVSPDIDLKHMGHFTDYRRHRTGSAAWLSKRPIFRQ